MSVKTTIKQSFGDASVSYDSVASLQRKVGKALLENIGQAAYFDSVVDIGCGTGFLIEELINQKKCSAELVVALDIAKPMLDVARAKLTNDQVSYLCADAEFLPLQPHSVDLVVSNLAVQWCSDLAKNFTEIKRVLKPGGVLLLTTFGTQTLHELKSAWLGVDDYSHVNTFIDKVKLTDLLKRIGFYQVKVESDIYISTYESVWSLMTELKQLGAQTVVAGRNRHLTGKASIQNMISAYQKHDKNGMVPATFEVISVIAKT